jgi:hypothetical protein
MAHYLGPSHPSGLGWRPRPAQPVLFWQQTVEFDPNQLKSSTPEGYTRGD